MLKLPRREIQLKRCAFQWIWGSFFWEVILIIWLPSTRGLLLALTRSGSLHCAYAFAGCMYVCDCVIVIRNPKSYHKRQSDNRSTLKEWNSLFKGVLHPWTLLLKTLCIFSKYKATLGKVCNGSGQKCSKELKNNSFISVETVVVKLL